MSVNNLLLPEATSPVFPVPPLRLVQAELAPGMSVVCTASEASAASPDSLSPESDAPACKAARSWIQAGQRRADRSHVDQSFSARHAQCALFCEPRVCPLDARYGVVRW